MTDPDNLYEWMQTADHFTAKPEGPVFLFFSKNEAEYQTPSRVLDQGKVEYEDENYIALGYPSYDAMRADFLTEVNCYGKPPNPCTVHHHPLLQ